MTRANGTSNTHEITGAIDWCYDASADRHLLHPERHPDPYCGGATGVCTARVPHPDPRRVGPVCGPEPGLADPARRPGAARRAAHDRVAAWRPDRAEPPVRHRYLDRLRVR